MEELEKLEALSNAVKRNGSWNYVTFIPYEKDFFLDFERIKVNKKYVNGWEIENGAAIFIKAESKEEALKIISKFLTIKSKRKAVKWLESNPVKELGKETLRLRKYQIYRESSDGRLKLSYNRYYLKEIERKIHLVCHTRHYKGGRKRDLRELIKYVNQIVRAIRKESVFLWVVPGQKKGFNREVKNAVFEALTSMYGFKKKKARAYITKYVLFWK
jgi:hypothetical protein